jgi:hypothetical protein
MKKTEAKKSCATIPLNDDCSAQDRPRELKLVSLEPLEIRILNMSLNFSSMSVNETAMQNVLSVHKKSLG